MEIAKAILAALAIVFAAAEIQLQLSKRQGTTPSSEASWPICQQRLASCDKYVFVLSFLVYKEPLPSLVERIDSYCLTYQQAVDCVQPLLIECGIYVTSSIKAPLFEWEYICSARGRSLLREANSSRCYTDGNQTKVVGNLMSDIIRSSTYGYVESRNVGACQAYQSIAARIYQNITQNCGQPVAAFFSEYYSSSVYPNVPNCPPVNSTQPSVTRGV
ncbi:hypothetical protein BsWGS_23414 [Bradybaena similaris]